MPPTSITLVFRLREPRERFIRNDDGFREARLSVLTEQVNGSDPVGILITGIKGFANGTIAFQHHIIVDKHILILRLGSKCVSGRREDGKAVDFLQLTVIEKGVEILPGRSPSPRYTL